MGGAGKPEHISKTLKLAKVSGVVTANLFNFFGVFIIQWLTGVIIFNLNERYGFSIATSYNVAFSMIIVCLLISSIFYLRTDEK